jgi:hypothetical protein
VTLNEAIAAVRITEVFTALGGAPLRHGRGRAFWRDGDGYNIALDDRKNAWCDHAHGKGGGVLDLIQTALTCDRAGAVAWLASTFSLDINQARPLTLVEKRRYVDARAKAERFLTWREMRLQHLRDRRDFHLEVYHRALRNILTHGLNHPSANMWADSCELHERRYQDLDAEIDAFANAPFETLVPTFEQRRSA